MQQNAYVKQEMQDFGELRLAFPASTAGSITRERLVAMAAQ